MSADEKAGSDSVRMLPSALRLKLSAVAELEAGPLSQWLCSALAEAELPVVCVETAHAGGRVGSAYSTTRMPA